MDKVPVWAKRLEKQIKNFSNEFKLVIHNGILANTSNGYICYYHVYFGAMADRCQPGCTYNIRCSNLGPSLENSPSVEDSSMSSSTRKRIRSEDVKESSSKKSKLEDDELVLFDSDNEDFLK